MTVEVAILLSVGRHPASSRLRPADLDTRALELALRLAAAPGLSAAIRLHAVHAGSAHEPALRGYLAMGLSRLTVLDVAADADPVPALSAHLAARRPALMLAGLVAESGEASGFLPYAIAQALDSALIPGIAAVERIGDSVEVLQALPRGQRRRVQAPFPLVCTVDPAAPAPRAGAFAKARRGQLEVIATPAPPDLQLPQWQEQPSRRQRPRRLLPAVGSAADRVRALSEPQSGRGRLLLPPSPHDAAKAIYDYLAAEGIIASSDQDPTA